MDFICFMLVLCGLILLFSFAAGALDGIFGRGSARAVGVWLGAFGILALSFLSLAFALGFLYLVWCCLVKAVV